MHPLFWMAFCTEWHCRIILREEIFISLIFIILSKKFLLFGEIYGDEGGNTVYRLQSRIKYLKNYAINRVM